MKKEQLKKLMMPIIRECIQEILSEPQVAEQLVREGMQIITNTKPTPSAMQKPASKEEVYNQYVQRSLNNKVSNSTKKEFVNEAVISSKPKSLLDEMLEGVKDIDSRDRASVHQLSTDDVEDLPGSGNWAEIMKRL